MGRLNQPAEKDKTNPATRSNAHDLMLPRWDKIDTLLEGTQAMRNAGTAYLPQHPEESDPAYDERRRTAVLFNMTELTLDALVGRPFSDPVKLSEDMPAEIQEMAETDMDLQGNNLAVFLREWFREGLAKSFCHVLVEFPRLPDEEELGRARTMADDRREGVRPYWVLVRPENVIFAHADIIDGREVLRHVRIQEIVMEQDGFREVAVDQIRQFDAGMELEDGTFIPTAVTIWRKKEKKDDEWEVHEQFELGVPFIPLVTFYADRDAMMMGKPPLLDLADLNIRHWQSYADQIHVLTVTRFPILAVSGGTDSEKTVIGPNFVLENPDPAGRWYYVEHSGAAIAAGRDEMKDLEVQMDRYGTQFLRKRPSVETATARAMDSAEATSPLQDMTVRFMDAVQTALKFTAVWLRLDDGGTVIISTEFGPEDALTQDITALRDARKERDLSREQSLIELMRRGILRDDFDIKENQRQLDEESASALADMVKLDIDEAGDDGDEDEGEEEQE